MCAQQRARVLTPKNTNGVFNCFWLRSASWARPIRRPEETVKNYLRKKGLRFSGRQCVRLCVTVRTCVRLWDNCSILLCVLDVRALLFVSTCEQATALWVRGRKCHIAYLVTCCDGVQYLGFPPPSLETERVRAAAKVSGDWNQTQSSGQSWKQHREKSHAEKPSPRFYVTCVALNFILFILNSQKCFKMKGESCR